VLETKIVTLGADVLLAEVSTRLGPLNEVVTPDGAENVSVTGEAKLASDPMYSVTVPEAAWAMDIPVVENATEKSP
jgi:hypothetical protein